mgnify:CR=1 FL=1
MSILDLESYRNTGKIKYVTGSHGAGLSLENNLSLEIDRDALDSLSAVMEMSTDELIGELTIRNTVGNSMRSAIKTVHIIEELGQRLIAIEYILMATISNYPEEDL